MPTKIISSLKHPLVKQMLRLRTEAKYRYQEGLVLVSGIKLIRELSENHNFKIIISRQNYQPDFKLRAEQTVHVSEEILKKISGLVSPEPLAAILTLPQQADLKNCQRLLILDHLNDPGNLGTLMRTALALGWDGVFVTTHSSDPYNEKALRAAKGATFKLAWRQGSLEELSEILAAFKLYAADAHGELITTLIAPTSLEKIALVLGNEAHGLNDWFKSRAHIISIGMTDQMESLNVASAGAILMYFLYR